MITLAMYIVSTVIVLWAIYEVLGLIAYAIDCWRAKRAEDKWWQEFRERADRVKGGAK